MKSQTSLAARNCRLQEWSKMVHSCNNRPIGISVDEWCRENSITTANYYYRMTQVRKACLDSLSDEAENQEVVPVPMNLVAPAEEPGIKKLLPEVLLWNSIFMVQLFELPIRHLMHSWRKVHPVPVPGKNTIFKKKVPVPGKNYRSEGRWMEEGTGRGRGRDEGK